MFMPPAQSQDPLTGHPLEGHLLAIIEGASDGGMTECSPEALSFPYPAAFAVCARSDYHYAAAHLVLYYIIDEVWGDLFFPFHEEPVRAREVKEVDGRTFEYVSNTWFVPSTRNLVGVFVLDKSDGEKHASEFVFVVYGDTW
jgi:hypothetical protein